RAFIRLNAARGAGATRTCTRRTGSRPIPAVRRTIRAPRRRRRSIRSARSCSSTCEAAASAAAPSSRLARLPARHRRSDIMRATIPLVDSAAIALTPIDPELHYRHAVGPIEHPDLPECAMQIENIGWTLGNDCPYRCTHCYSMSARRKGMNLERWMIDRIVDQLVALEVETVNLGGNEPI